MADLLLINDEMGGKSRYKVDTINIAKIWKIKAKL